MDNNFVKMIGYDAEGKAHVLFDVTKENNDTEKAPMPKLETGMFIRLENDRNKETKIGFVYNDCIIWQDGGWDKVRDIHENEYWNNTKDDFTYLTIYEVKAPYFFPKKDKSKYDFRKVVWKGKVYYG